MILHIPGLTALLTGTWAILVLGGLGALRFLIKDIKCHFMQTMFYFIGRFKLRKDVKEEKPSVEQSGKYAWPSCQMDHDLLGMLLSILCQCNAKTELSRDQPLIQRKSKEF